jgi:hypothetical protein
MHMPDCTSQLAPPLLRLRHGVALALAVCTALSNAWAQQGAMPGGAMPSLPPQLMQQVEAAGGPAAEGLARLKRMNDPNAGKRAGDENLSCEQIKTELAQTKQTYDELAAKYDAMVDAKKASTERYAQATTGFGAQASQLARGLVVGATVGLVGTDAMKESVGKAAIAPELAMRQQQIDEGNQLGAAGEVKHGYYKRGVALVALGKTKGCKGVSLDQPVKELP